MQYRQNAFKVKNHTKAEVGQAEHIIGVRSLAPMQAGAEKR